MKTILSLLTAIAALALPAQLHAATVPVTITINSVFNISAGHAFGQPPDFYAQIWIDRTSVRTPTVPRSNGFTSPAGWTFTRNVSRAQRGGIALVRIELRDMDALVDIDPAGCKSIDPFGCAELSVTTPPVDSFGIDVALNLFDGSWAPRDPTGDSSVGAATSGNPQMACTTGAGTKVANICFTITVGAPTPETLTVSKTADSDRGFCAPGDCSLREAITRAESLDTVELLASTAPYLLDVFGNVHLAIHQQVLTITGPKNGGTAVIRQTRGGFRVFDVHGGAKLVLDHVSVTGGGGGPSTADPHHIHGGAIHNHGTIELTYVTITGNSALDATDTAAAPGGGGGIYNATGATAKLTNVTIAGNVAAISNMNTIPLPLGGGIAGPGTFTLRNTVIANNVAGATASNCGGSKPMNIIDEGGNLQFPGNDCGRLVTITLPRTGTSHTFWAPFFPTAVFDPLLPLDAVRTIFLPAPNGPAVDSGVAGCGPTDQAGRPAPRDGNGDGVVACDAGAMEAP